MRLGVSTANGIKLRPMLIAACSCSHVVHDWASFIHFYRRYHTDSFTNRVTMPHWVNRYIYATLCNMYIEDSLTSVVSLSLSLSLSLSDDKWWWCVQCYSCLHSNIHIYIYIICMLLCVCCMYICMYICIIYYIYITWYPPSLCSDWQLWKYSGSIEKYTTQHSHNSRIIIIIYMNNTDTLCGSTGILL